jgi:AraC-like DNA-binding protein
MLSNPGFMRDRTGMVSDPLSDVLDLVRARCLMSGGLIAGGAWALRFQQSGVIKFSAVAEGTCWLAMDCLPAPLRLETGDVILTNGAFAMILASDPALEPVDARGAYERGPDGIGRLGQDRAFFMLGGHVAVDPLRQDLLLDVLPPLIHVRGASPEAAALRWLLGQLVHEMGADRAGSALATAHLAHLMVVQALRAYLATSDATAGGWLRGLGDPRIAQALGLMHGEPARAWTLGELAKAVAMSRTAFALRFRTVVGMAPLSYLLDWRMRLAERDLRESDLPVSAIAFAIGYTSESAFSNAFKRTMRLAPTRYRTAHRAASRPTPARSSVRAG